MGRHIGAGSISPQTVRDALWEAARATGLDDHEIELVLRDDSTSGATAGAKHPRVPDPAYEPEAPSVTLLSEDGDGETDPLARFNLIDWHELKNSEDDGEEWLAEPLIAAGRMTALYSAPKAGKSLLVLELVAALALGLPVLGHPAREPVVVLYVDFENDPRGDIKPRLEDMGHDLDDFTGRLHVATFPSMARLDTPQGGADLHGLALELGAQLVVIDTVSRTVAGEENDNNTWLAFYRNTGVPLKRDGIACLRLDHAGKDLERGMRGGSAKYGDVDAVWRLVALSESVIELECTDHRMALPDKAFTLVRRTDPLRHEVSGDPFAVAMDAKESELAATLDRLEVPRDWGRDRVRKVLKEAGVKVQDTLLSRVIRARKLALPHPVPNRSGTAVPGPLSDSPVRRAPLGAPNGEQVRPVRTGSADESKPPPMFLVSCKRCYAPTDRDAAHATRGLCAKCSTTQEDL